MNYYFAQDLTATPLDHFEPADTAENCRHIEEGRDDDCLLAYRTRGEYCGKERTEIVAYNPTSARKQAYTFAIKVRPCARSARLYRLRTCGTRKPFASAIFEPGPALDGQQDQVPSFHLRGGYDLFAPDRVEDVQANK